MINAIIRNAVLVFKSGVPYISAPTVDAAAEDNASAEVTE